MIDKPLIKQEPIDSFHGCGCLIIIFAAGVAAFLLLLRLAWMHFHH